MTMPTSPGMLVAGRPRSGLHLRTRRPVILLVEDDAGDADLTREALAGGRYDSELHIVRDASAALAFMRREGQYGDAPVPDLILLDLNLPGLDGGAVLETMKHDPQLQWIPVVVLSSSSAPSDVHHAYARYANCYVTKPVGLEQFLTTVRAIEHFWIGVATLPATRV
jgi:CheY-like chemotaxis protein